MKIVETASMEGVYGFTFSISVGKTEKWGYVIRRGFTWKGNTGGMEESRVKIPLSRVEFYADFLRRAAKNTTNPALHIGDVFASALCELAGV